MFTGLIEEIGIIKALNKQTSGAVIQIQCQKVLEDLKTGDSIAINGACQTATKIGKDFFEVDAAIETLKLTNFINFTTGTKVNLERAMSATSRFGGHMVSGHVEGVASFIKKEKEGLAEIFYFEAPKNVTHYLVHKGSVCINGISLTITSLNNNIFSISVIPHTIKETTLPELKSGDIVNIEPDIIAKYVEKFLSKAHNTSSNLSVDFLKENGFY